MNLRQLRKLVNETVRSEQTKSRRGRGRTSQRWNTLVENTTRRVLFESDEGEEEASSGGSVTFTNQSNFKDFDDPMIDELFKQLKSEDPDASIYKAMEFTPKDDDGNDLPTVKPNPSKIVAWLADTGEEEVRKRIKLVGGKIPNEGLPKSEMPFLPGPSDAKGTVDDVVDALTPGGDYNVDFKENFKRGGLLEGQQLNRWNKLAGLLTEVAPPEKNSFIGMDAEGAEEYMTSGNPENDGDPAGDDAAEVEQPGKFAAADCIPTQTNILLPKALGMAAGKGPGKGVKGGDIGAYFSKQGHILDGHHRWAATCLNDPTEDLGGFAAIDMEAIGGTGKDGMKKALKHLTAIGNALGNKTKTK